MGVLLYLRLFVSRLLSQADSALDMPVRFLTFVLQSLGQAETVWELPAFPGWTGAGFRVWGLRFKP